MKLNELEHEIVEALSCAKMERASFVLTIDGKTYGDREAASDAIREATRSYRETWIIPQLERALKMIRAERASRNPRRMANDRPRRMANDRQERTA